MPGKSGCPVYRGEIPLISCIGGNLISRSIGVPVNRGSGKSGSDCTCFVYPGEMKVLTSFIIVEPKSGVVKNINVK